jgi:flavin-dependent dehydrogenase
VQVHLFSGGYAGLIGVGNGIANLCFAVEKDQVKKRRSIERLLEENLYQNARLREALHGVERDGEVHSAYPVFFSPGRCYGRGFLLVGDAARVTEPVTGEGVYFALKGGELAAHAIDRAFTCGDFSAREFSLYERACKNSFSLRAGVNRMIRSLVYRPALARPLIGLSSRTGLPFSPLVRWLCREELGEKSF